MQLVVHAPFRHPDEPRDGDWHCANGSAARSILNCKRGDGRRDLFSRSAPNISFPLAEVFRYLNSKNGA